MINQRIGRVKRMFRWAATEDLVPVEVFHRLAALPGRRRFRSGARESVPVQPISREAVDAVLPFVSSVVPAMIEVQLVSAMRPGELVAMRRRDLVTEGPVWRYTPESHKTLHHGHHRTVFLGPKAQAFLSPFLARDAEAFLFSPVESVAWWNAKRRAERRSPMTPSQKARRPKANGRRRPRDRFSVHSYDRAIARACEKANIARWTTNQLRHTTATRIEEEMGLEAAAAVLGHKTIETTRVNAHGRKLLPRRIAETRGYSRRMYRRRVRVQFSISTACPNVRRSTLRPEDPGRVPGSIVPPR